MESDEKNVCDYVRGLPIPKRSGRNLKYVEDTMDHVARDGDVICLSFPKTGSTWLQYIMLQIVFRGEHLPEFKELSYNTFPVTTHVSKAHIDALTGFRSYKVHIPLSMVTLNRKAKYIYIYRNPGDVVVSYYHFSKYMYNYKMDFDVFFDDFVNEAGFYGSYFDHVLAAYAHIRDENFLLLSYEGLQNDFRKNLFAIARFLGEEHHAALKDDPQLVQKILKNMSFDNMKSKVPFTMGQNAHSAQTEACFFRKGIVGDSINVLSPKQKEKLRTVVEDKMKSTPFVEEWQSYI